MEKVTVYSAMWCGDCRRAKRFLNEKGVRFEEIDIETDPPSAEKVIQWSGGRRVVPTITIECASQPSALILHNPPLSTLAQVFQDHQE